MKKLISKVLIAIFFTTQFLSVSSVSVFANTTSPTVFSTASKENFSKFLPSGANSIALEEYRTIVEYAGEYKEAFGLKDEDFKNVKIGEPFCIFAIEDSSQSPVYYYPIINSKNEFVLMLTVINTNHTWQCSIDSELVSDLNKINYYHDDYIFYKVNDGIVAQGKDSMHNIIVPTSNNPYSNLSYNDIHNKIIDWVSTMEEINIEEDFKTTDGVSDIAMYTPAFSREVNDQYTVEKVMKLYNAKGQGSYGRCWAASVATIVNYIKGKNIGAASVCDTMHIGYNDGATNQDAKDALKKYGVDYGYIRNRSLNWSEITQNINNKKPIYLFASGKSSNHAVTIVGYKRYKVNEYITLWDSASNNGKGTTRIINYSGDYTIIQSSSTGPIFKWSASLSAK